MFFTLANNQKIISSWWFQSEKYVPQCGSFPQNLGVKKGCLKPPPVKQSKKPELFRGFVGDNNNTSTWGLFHTHH